MSLDKAASALERFLASRPEAQDASMLYTLGGSEPTLGGESEAGADGSKQAQPAATGQLSGNLFVQLSLVQASIADEALAERK